MQGAVASLPRLVPTPDARTRTGTAAAGHETACAGTLNSRGSRPSVRYRRPRLHPDHGGAGARRRRAARPHRKARTRGLRSRTSGTTRARAQKVTSELSHAQGELRRVEELRQRLDDLPVLYEMAAEEEGAGARRAGRGRRRAASSCARTSRRWRSARCSSGEYDEREALVNIRSGAGGVDAADWAEMLMRMYIRWAEKHNYPVEVFDTSYAEEAGIKSATFAVHAPFAYGTLSVEQGTHRLVRISPFDNQSRRQTSFAEVEVLPVVETTDHIDIPEQRRARRRLPIQRARRAVGEHHRLGGSTHPHPDRYRGHLPEREVAAAEQGLGDASSSGKAVGTQAFRRTRRDGRVEGRRRQLVGQPDALLRVCTRTKWSRTCAPSTRSAIPRRYWTETSTDSSRRESVGAIDEMTNSTVLALSFGRSLDRLLARQYRRLDPRPRRADRPAADRRPAGGPVHQLVRATGSSGASTPNTTESDQLVRSESAKHRQAVASVISWVSIALLFVIVAVEITDILAIPVGSLVAPAAVLGAALGFGAQRIVQDLLAGFFIITEKQYGFGDLVSLTVAGIAATRRGHRRGRHAAGHQAALHRGRDVHHPQRADRQDAEPVQGLGARRRRHPGADIGGPQRASTTCCTTSRTSAMEDPALKDLLLDAPQLMGVESIELDTVNLRMVARTLPGKQFEVGRRLRVLVVAGAAPGRHRVVRRRQRADGRRHRASVATRRRRRGRDAGARRSRSRDLAGSRPKLGGRIRVSTARAHRRVRRAVLGARRPSSRSRPPKRPCPRSSRPASCPTRTTPGCRVRNVRRPKEPEYTTTTTTPTTTRPRRRPRRRRTPRPARRRRRPTTTVVDPDGPGGPLGPQTLTPDTDRDGADDGAARAGNRARHAGCAEIARRTPRLSHRYTGVP